MTRPRRAQTPGSARQLSGTAARGVTTVQIVAGVVGLVMVGFVVLLATRDVARNDPANFDIVSRKSPPVQGVSFTGETFDLDGVLLANRNVAGAEQTWTVVNFFASWCVGCREEHDDLVRLDTQGVRGADGAVCSTELVGVTFNDTAEDAADFFAERGGSWPVLVDGDVGRMAIDFGVTSVPETVLIARDGTVVQKWIGAVTYEQLAAAISC